MVIDPVAAPITPDITVGLTLFGQAPASGNAATDGYPTRLQQMSATLDTAGRLFLIDTPGSISVVGAPPRGRGSTSARRCRGSAPRPAPARPR